jgi:hypothetical protein
MRLTRTLLLVAMQLAFLIGAGCTSRAPSKPQLSPAESGAKAIEEYDEDGNGSISEDEAEAAPGLLAAFPKIDSDGDGEVTATEIEDRIVYYQTSTSWVINGTCKVTYKRRPLEGATVVFEPESFLGPSFHPCSGVTDERGEAFITREAADSIAGIYLGFYRVRITKEKDNGKELIPTKYNEETTLGFEANNDVPDDAMYGNIRFDLK